MNKLGNFTIVLPSYNCDKNCPFCISKNNKKFNFENFDCDSLSNKLYEIRSNKIKFDKVVLSGNGEPSLYDYSQLEDIAKVIKENADLFDVLRVHTSGNIFLEKDKFNLFNDLVSNIEFDILRVALNPETDMKCLGYSINYMKTTEFKKAKKIKVDIGLTNLLEKDDFFEKLEEFLVQNQNVSLIRFKNLMSGDKLDTKQAKWLKNKRMSKDEFVSFAKNALEYCNSNTLDSLFLKNGTLLKFENTGNYPKDVVFCNRKIMNYNEKELDISQLLKMSLIVGDTKKIRYDSFKGDER